MRSRSTRRASLSGVCMAVGWLSWVISPSSNWMPSVYTQRVLPAAVGRLALDPLLAAFPDLLLPDRDDFLEAVDQRVAGLERLLAVRRGHRDQHGRLADLEPPR